MKARSSGPCYKSEHFVAVNTNEHGVLQLHPCAECVSVFVWSVDLQQWLSFEEDDEALFDRLTEEVKKARAEKAPGF